MKSILEQFYYGNITPCETPITDNRFKKITSDLDNIEKEMLEKCLGAKAATRPILR